MDNLGIKNWHVKWVTNDKVRWGNDGDIEDYACSLDFFQTYDEATAKAIEVLPTDIFGVVEVVEMTCVPVPDYPDRTYAKPTRWHTVEKLSKGIFWSEIDDSLLRLSLETQPKKAGK